MLRASLLTAVLSAVLFMVIGLFLPGDWRASEVLVVPGPEAEVRAVIEDPSTWQEWLWAPAVLGVDKAKVAPGTPSKGPGAVATLSHPSFGTRRVVLGAWDGRRLPFEVFLGADVPVQRGVFEASARSEGGTLVTINGEGSVGLAPFQRWTVGTGVIEKAERQRYKKALVLLAARWEGVGDGK